MMAIVDLRDICYYQFLIASSLLTHSLFISLPQFSSPQPPQRMNEKISINFGSFFFCAPRTLYSKLRVYTLWSTIIQYFYPSLCSTSRERKRRKKRRKIFKSCSINHIVTPYISPNITRIIQVHSE